VLILVWEGATAAIAAVFAVWANWDYLREVAKREAKPRLASWVIWTIAMTVGSVGAARMGQWPAAVLGFAGAATCGSVVVAGWRRGDKKLTWLDRFALLAGGAGIVLLTAAMLWPDRFPVTVAIGISVLTDLCAFVPTYDNARNGEEVARPYIIDTIGAAAALAGARHFPQPVGVIYPAYQMVACAAAAWLAAVGKARANKAPEHLKVTAETNADVRRNAFAVRDNLMLGDPAMAAGLRRHSGGRTAADATTIGLSPRPDLVARIDRLPGMNVVPGAGSYIHPSHPPWVCQASVDELEQRLEQDVTRGVVGSEVLPGVLREIGMGAPPEPCERRVLRAAARVACRYGMSVIVHVTGDGLFGIQAVEDCADEGLSADRVILGHLDEHMDRARHADLTGTGATIALDTWGSEVTLALNSRRSGIDRMRCLPSLLEQGRQNQIGSGRDFFLKAHLHELVGNGYEHLPARVLSRLERYGCRSRWRSR
jgi:phosphotriesterase-related protein